MLKNKKFKTRKEKHIAKNKKIQNKKRETFCQKTKNSKQEKRNILLKTRKFKTRKEKHFTYLLTYSMVQGPS